MKTPRPFKLWGGNLGLGIGSYLMPVSATFLYCVSVCGALWNYGILELQTSKENFPIVEIERLRSVVSPL